MRFLNLWLLTIAFLSPAMGQLQIKLPIWRVEAFGQTDTAYFGVDERATYCIDTSLGEHEIWWQACGLVPCLAFVDIRTGPGACLGEGTIIDLRPFYSTTQIDTYKLKFDGYYPIVFHWQPNIALYYGAMTFMNSPDTNTATIKVNMLAQDSFVITSQLIGFRWYIRAESPNPVTHVQLQEISFPAAPSLLQNYPNPFNPSTTIGFTLAREAVVTITVYDVLGREVRVAMRERKFNQGIHNLYFSASDLPSGMYFCRLVARNVRTGLPEYADVKKMTICK
jgi:hypothetical protein